MRATLASNSMTAGTSHVATARSLLLAVLLAALPLAATPAASQDFVVVDTGQDGCYDDAVPITCPPPGDPFHGQDAQYDGVQPAYTVSGDGLTVHDERTGLTWQQSPDLDRDGDIDVDDKLSWPESLAYPATLNAESFGGFDDWRLPTIKELYSLIDFRGQTGMSAQTSTPYIDTTVFAFAYGDESAGERFIDAQYRTRTEYVGTTMMNDPTVFGVNFADGRIKGYPRDMMLQYVRCVRGNPSYGVNDYVDNGDGTITDLATGLMWTASDSDQPMDWEAALAHAENLDTAGHTDWRLPNAKELESIVDYTRAPDATDPAARGPAIDPIFSVTETESWCWASTTHLDGPTAGWGVYVCFGQAWGYMGPPGGGQWLNVHGAGSQRSDPKRGDPASWPYGHGPQGDEVRILNYVRCVRDADGGTGIGESGSGGTGNGTPDGDASGEGGTSSPATRPGLRAAPNPSSASVDIELELPAAGVAVLEIFDVAGRRLRTFHDVATTSGIRTLHWDGTDAGGRALPPGIYFARLTTDGAAEPHAQRTVTTKLVLVD